MPTIRVNLGPRSYDIVVTTRALERFPTFLRERKPALSAAFIVTDSNADPQGRPLADSLVKAGLRVRTVSLPPGEASKSLANAARLYDELADWPADRQTVVVAVGGGVVGDLAGFVAATYNRGLALLMVPTTLLAMVDSSVGGKVGVNHPKGKNLIGAFHQPLGVWIDTATLETLPEREYRSGLAEVVKYGIILDAEFFAYLEAHAEDVLKRDRKSVETIVARSCRLKADVVEKDEREETGLRMVLNYGHTFAHAFETVGGYGAWLHGEAVAAGMVCASRLAERRGLIGPDVTQRQVRLLEQFKLPVAPLPAWDVDALVACMHRDKKAQGGRLRFILPTCLGAVSTFDDVPESLVREVLTRP